MALSLYRRHRRDCKAGHSEELRSGEFDERKKAWKRCSCPIFASGTLAGTHRRQTTGQWEWSDAKAVAAEWEAAKGWDTHPKEIAPPASAKKERITVQQATGDYLARCSNRGIEASTLSKYRTFIKQLHAYCDKRGYVMLDQLTVGDMDRFYASWKDGKRARGPRNWNGSSHSLNSASSANGWSRTLPTT